MTQKELDFLEHYRQALEFAQDNHNEESHMDFMMVPVQRDSRRPSPGTLMAQEAHNETKKRLFRRA